MGLWSVLDTEHRITEWFGLGEVLGSTDLTWGACPAGTTLLLWGRGAWQELSRREDGAQDPLNTSALHGVYLAQEEMYFSCLIFFFYLLFSSPKKATGHGASLCTPQPEHSRKF